MIRKVVLLLSWAALAWSCRQEVHFVADAQSRQQIQQDFETKKAILAGAPENLLAVFDQPLTQEEREALQFLYAYSPLIDLSYYGGDFLLQNVRLSLQVREEMPWGKEIPELIFRHFVLPVRGGNEGLDSSRMVFYGELKDRVKKCSSMEEAALEVNHWCHEKAIYKPTNARTCSPLTMTTTAYGRCGEEAVFALAAMRSVGIPARQVYTPRWAHCDDNHAWIEVWVDGTWKYLGACEPEPRLDIAWFTAPVRRGVFMTARVFGRYTGEEVVSMNPNMTSVNVTGNYTDARKVKVKVVNEVGKPVPGAKVEYKVYNYGEFYPAVILTANPEGVSELTVGQGDWLIWASDGKQFGFGKLEAASQNEITVVVDKTGKEKFHLAYDMVPPVEKEYQALVPDEERAVNDRRFMYEDSLRNAYIASFMKEDEIIRKAGEWKVDAEKLVRILRESRGNYPEIIAFLQKVNDSPETDMETALDLLTVVAGKDLQDTKAAVWEDHLQGAVAYKKKPRISVSGNSYAELYREYILNPRVKYEQITPYRKLLKEYLAENGISTVEGVLAAIQKMRIVDSVNTAGVATPPEGVLKAGVTDTRSKELFFVAACRTMGLAARLNPMDGKPEYNEGKGWQQAVFTPSQQVGERGKLMITYAGGEVKDPAYYTHFTISRIANGRVYLIDLGSNADVDMGGGAQYSKIFKTPVSLEAGDYILVTGNRRSDGAVLTEVSSFTVKPGELTRVKMKVRDVTEVMKIWGKVQLPLSYMPEGKTAPQTMKLPKQGYTAVAWIAANQEPTNHLVRDMSNMKADFEAKGIPMYFMFTDQAQMKKFARHDFKPLPENMLLGYDPEGKLLERVARSLNLKNADNLPLILMINQVGEVAFISQGYRVGLGTQIIKFIK